MFEIYPEVPEILTSNHRWYGGETKALQQLKERLDFEKDAFISGFYLPNQVNPDLLSPPSSLSAALRYGCLSIRKYRTINLLMNLCTKIECLLILTAKHIFRFYWDLSSLFIRNFDGDLLPQYSATSQLIWRDYFYTMSFDNKNFGQMEENPACIQISWNDINIEKNFNALECWKNGKTGYPFIDAGMRQLLQVKLNNTVSIKLQNVNSP